MNSSQTSRGVVLQRSALYVPATNERALAKSRALPVDIVIIDLEDAVAPDLKEAARRAAAAAIEAGGFGPRQVLLRVNGLDTAWGQDDLAALRHLPVDGIVIPKVRSARDVIAADRQLADSPARLRLWAMIETCEAILHIGGIAAMARRGRLCGFVLGTNDLLRELRGVSRYDRAPLHHALATTVLAARAFGLSAIDGVCNRLDDVEAVRRECEQARAFGFDGKSLVHPAQIAPCNANFSPSEGEIERARAIVAAVAAPGSAGIGAVRVGGELVEAMHVDAARQLLEMAAEIERRAATGV